MTGSGISGKHKSLMIWHECIEAMCCPTAPFRTGCESEHVVLAEEAGYLVVHGVSNVETKVGVSERRQKKTEEDRRRQMKTDEDRRRQMKTDEDRRRRRKTEEELEGQPFFGVSTHLDSHV